MPIIHYVILYLLWPNYVQWISKAATTECLYSATKIAAFALGKVLGLDTEWVLHEIPDNSICDTYAVIINNVSLKASTNICGGKRAMIFLCVM